jgi:hypothetical protein
LDASAGVLSAICQVNLKIVKYNCTVKGSGYSLVTVRFHNGLES